VSFLDPRPETEAAARPYVDSANIPADEIAARVAELPRKDEVIRVIGPEPYKQQALGILRRLGRNVESGPEPVPNGKSKVQNQKFVGRLWRPNDFLEESVQNLNPGMALDLACGTGRDAVYLASLGWEVTGVDVLPDAVLLAEQLAKRYLTATSRLGNSWEKDSAASRLLRGASQPVVSPPSVEKGHQTAQPIGQVSLLYPLRMESSPFASSPTSLTEERGLGFAAPESILHITGQVAPADSNSLRSIRNPTVLHSTITSPQQLKIENRKLKIHFSTLDLTKSVPSQAYDLITCFFYFNPDLLSKLHTLLNPDGIALIELFTDEDKAKHGKPKKTMNPAELPQLLLGLQITDQQEGWHHGRHTVRVAASVR
jgi:SAM-dependent methyltransferase